MTARTWFTSAVVGLVLAGAWLTAVRGPGEPRLRSAHSEPATMVPPQSVAVTAQGKTFHQSGCKFLHGPPRMQSAGQAIAEGYTPCSRCLPR